MATCPFSGEVAHRGRLTVSGLAVARLAVRCPECAGVVTLVPLPDAYRPRTWVYKSHRSVVTAMPADGSDGSPPDAA